MKNLKILRKCFPALFLPLLAKFGATKKYLYRPLFELFCRIFDHLAIVAECHKSAADNMSSFLFYILLRGRGAAFRREFAHSASIPLCLTGQILFDILLC